VRLAAGAGVGALALGLAACGGSGGSSSGGSSGSPVFGGTLKLVGAGGNDNFDPTSGYTTSAAEVFRATTRQLFSYPASTNATVASTPAADLATVVPTIANGGISADGKTYTIHIKQGINWDSNPARQVTADDFIRSFKHMCNPASPVGNTSYYVPLIQGMQSFCTPYLADTKISQDPSAMAAYENSHQISGLSAPNSSTLQIKLVQPASDFLNILAMQFATPVPVENEKYEPQSPSLYTHMLVLGPYKIGSMTVGKSVTLVRNSEWKSTTDSLRHQYVNQIQITEGEPNSQTVFQQVETGAQDLSYDVAMDPATVAQLQGKNDPNLKAYGPQISNPYLVFNFQTPNKAITTLLVRQAVNYAIDKQALVRIYAGSKFNTPLNTVIPPGSSGYQPYNLYPTPNSSGDTTKCKALLKQAGFPNGFTVKFAYRTSGNHPQMYQSIANDLKSCGINVEGVPQSAADFYSQFLNEPSIAKAGKWDIAEVGWAPDWFGNNGRSIISPLFDGRNYGPDSSNFGDYNSDVTNGFIDKASAAKTLAEADGYWHNADMQIMKDAAIVPFMAQYTPWYHSTRVKNAIWYPTSQQFDLTNLWLSGS
jgi:peptide/nickel transport system substrate-binding protein